MTHQPLSIYISAIQAFFFIGCATTTMNASSFKGSGSGASKTRIDTGYVIVVSPVVVVVVAADLSPLSPSVEGQRGSGVWILTLLMLMVATLMSPPPRSNFVTTKFLHLPDIVTFVPISTSRTAPKIIMVYLFAP